jgi:hypothetical protein
MELKGRCQTAKYNITVTFNNIPEDQLVPLNSKGPCSNHNCYLLTGQACLGIAKLTGFETRGLSHNGPILIFESVSIL